MSELANRFWHRVNIRGDEDCWEYRGGINSTGRGIFAIDRKSIHAHRAAWKFVYGEIPDGMWVLHHCDNGKCVNPKHLFLGTPKDNTQDMIGKGRKVTLRGDNDPKSKLDSDDVIKIVSMYKTGKYSQANLGKVFGVSRSAVLDILRGKSWREITGLELL